MAISSKTSPAKLETAKRRPLRKTLKRLIYAGFGLLAIFTIVFFLLPVWVSNDQGRAYVLERINARMNAKLAVDDWSLSWFHGTELKNVTITLPDGSRLFACPHIQSELTLWGILWGNYDVGTTPINNMQITLNKYADGSTSLDALAADGHGGAKLLRLLQTLRGSIQVNSSVVTINSIATRESLTYTDFSAALTIASPYAPFHVQANAVAPDRVLMLNATLPAPRSWPEALGDVRLATSDMELSATNLPTLLLCDLLELDRGWRDSVGPAVESLTFANHATAPNVAGNPSLNLRGTDGAMIRGRCIVRADAEGRLAVSIVNTENQELLAVLRHSHPVAQLLRRINPIFENWVGAADAIRLESGELLVSTGQSRGSIRLTFPSMTFSRTGIVAKLLSISIIDAPLKAEVSPVRVRLGSGQFQYEHLTFNFADRQRIIFSGSVSLAGELHLLATVPSMPAGSGGVLGNSSTDIPLTGTVEKPVVELPK